MQIKYEDAKPCNETVISKIQKTTIQKNQKLKNPQNLKINFKENNGLPMKSDHDNSTGLMSKK